LKTVRLPGRAQRKVEKAELVNLNAESKKKGNKRAKERGKRTL